MFVGERNRFDINQGEIGDDDEMKGTNAGLSNFSSLQKDSENFQEEEPSRRGGLSGFSDVLTVEPESKFEDDTTPTPPVAREDEGLSYSNNGSILSSIRGLGFLSRDTSSSRASKANLSRFSSIS